MSALSWSRPAPVGPTSKPTYNAPAPRNYVPRQSPLEWRSSSSDKDAQQATRRVPLSVPAPISPPLSDALSSLSISPSYPSPEHTTTQTGHEAARPRTGTSSNHSGGSSASSSSSSLSLQRQHALGGGVLSPSQNRTWATPNLVKSYEEDPYRPPSFRSYDDRQFGIDLSSIWSDDRRSSKSSIPSPRSRDEYHLVSTPDDLVCDPSCGRGDSCPPCNNNRIRVEDKSKQYSASPHIQLDPSQFSLAQLSALASAFAPTTPQTTAYSPNSPLFPSSRSPDSHIAHLILQSSRLAQGLAQPPANRGFRARPTDMFDKAVNDETNTTVFVGGLSQSISESILHDLFQPFGAIAYVKVPPGKGCGFVQFHGRQHAEFAIKQMQGFEVLGCSLRTHWGRSQTDRNAPASATPEQITAQVVSVCSAFGIAKEQTELVLRVMQACQAGAAGPG